MASPPPSRSASAASSQPAVTQATSSLAAQRSSTLNIDATNAFRPSIPQRGSRIPAVEIDKLSLSKMNNQNNGKSTSIDTFAMSTIGSHSSFLPPPLPHTPIKGISNAQARTARKSAPSTSNRADGYSTSSSGGGGKKSISGAGKNSKEKRERDYSAIEEVPITPALGVEHSDLTQCSPRQIPLALPKQQLQPQIQVQKIQQEIQPPLENSEKSQQQKQTISPVIPAPPSFAGPSTQIVGVKRSAPLAIPSVYSNLSGKPKRQKIATPKAAALANDLGMNADGSAKKRKPRKNVNEKAGKEKEKVGKAKGKELKNVNVFLTLVGGHYDLEEPVQHCHPKLPPPYQKPGAQQGQGKKDTSISQTTPSDPVVSGNKLGVSSSRTLATSSDVSGTPQSNFVSTSHMQTPVTQKRTPDVISISSSPSIPISYHTPTSKLEDKSRQHDQKDNKIVRKADELGRHQNIPITIDDRCSEGEDSSNGGRSLGRNCVYETIETNVKENEVNKPNTIGYDRSSPEPTQASDEFFTQCMNASDDEHIKLLEKIEAFTTLLGAKVKIHSPNFDTEHYLQRQKDGTTLAKITARLKHVGVLTDEGKVITLDEWKLSGMPKFKGRFVFPEYLEIWKGAQSTEKSDGDTSLNGKSQPPGRCEDKTDSDIDMMDVDHKRTYGPVDIPMKPQDTTVIEGCAVVNGKGQAKAKESPEIDSSEEKLGLVKSASLAAEITRTPSRPQKPTPTGKLESSAKDLVPQSQPGQKPLSPSNQIQAEADASVINFMLKSDVFESATSSPVSGKGKRKAFATPTVQDFLKESAFQEIRSPQRPSSNEREEDEGDHLLARIFILNQREISIRVDIDALAAKSKQGELRIQQSIARSRAGITDDKLTSELGLEMKYWIDWNGFRKATKELRDFQDDMRREELSLADKAARISEEKLYLIGRRKRLRLMESESNTTPSLTTSEERSLQNSSSTAPTSTSSSVSGSSVARQGTSSRIIMGARATHPEMSIGHELLQALIPWAKQLGETSAEDVAPTSTETGPHQVKSKKKPIRKKKHW